MRRADRLFQIVQYLRGGRLLTARILAERLEVSERTVYRDIADLIGNGVPIEGESGVGYMMRSGYDLPPLMFSRDEMVAMVTGARIMRAWGGAAMAQAAEEALIKIEAVLPSDALAQSRQVQVHAMTMPQMTDKLRKLIDQLEQAVDDKTRLILKYSDANGQATQRPTLPMGLWFWGKVWTLVAWCELRDDFRMFRLDRIDEARPDGKFKPGPEQNLTVFYAQQAALGHHRQP